MRVSQPSLTQAFQWRLILGLLAVLALAFPAAAVEIGPFIGSYKGSAEVVDSDGNTTPRDMSVDISSTANGFNVSWSTITYKADGRVKEQHYSVDFRPSDRSDVFSAAMKRNVFGHEVPLDPMKGEPFVWGRIDGATLTVYSLFIDEDGGYEMQQFDRTLVSGGLDLSFSRVRNGEQSRTVDTFLQRQ